MSVTRYHDHLSSRTISEKTNDPILRKLIAGRMDGWTDTQTDESDFIGRCLTNVERPIGYLTLVIWSKKKTEYDAKISDMKAK